MWDASAISHALARAVERVLSTTWTASDNVPISAMPWGLPRSGEPLLVGENLTYQDLTKRCAPAIASRLGLSDAAKLLELHERLQRDEDSVIGEVADSIWQVFAETARTSRFYQEAADLEWRLGQMPGADRNRLHPRLRMPDLSPDLEDLLRGFPILWALCADAENDPKLSEAWSKKGGTSNGDRGS